MGHTVAKLGTGGDGRQARTRRTAHKIMWGLWPSVALPGTAHTTSRLSIGRGHSAVQWSTCSLRKE